MLFGGLCCVSACHPRCGDRCFFLRNQKVRTWGVRAAGQMHAPNPQSAGCGARTGSGRVETGLEGAREGETGTRVACDVLSFSPFCERVGRARAVGFHTQLLRSANVFSYGKTCIGSVGNIRYNWNDTENISLALRRDDTHKWISVTHFFKLDMRNNPSMYLQSLDSIRVGPPMCRHQQYYAKSGN